MKIYKYPLPLGDVVAIRMPVGAKVLTVQTQADRPYIWALVEPDSHNETDYIFVILGTGHKADAVEGQTYIGTFQLGEGSLVFHVFHLTDVISWRLYVEKEGAEALRIPFTGKDIVR